MKLKSILSVCLALILTGCASSHVTRTSSTAYAETQPGDVEILFERPTRTYEVIGAVSGQGTRFASQTDVLNSMREQAAKVGADAILMGGAVENMSNWAGRPNWKTGNALAIKWK